ncbi:MAG TPA: polysaccharide pyruvyl transferase CsaB [Bacillota bacterium]|nr:polysaccharide pyruvyl transferase CsaB [Bacillota bacterium]HOL08780.1 polysaccharide pyruvyl transferase CsaB [Bacillota bacterium]HPO96870.1 polysaccharide pyruvyl transferase CsaB [Bacillota bacterium]
MNKVVLFGYYGSANLGDETNLAQLVDYLKQLRPELSIAVITADPEETAKKFSVEAIPKFNFRQIFKVFQEADCLIGGGGTLFQDRSSLRSLLYYLLIIVIAKISKLKVFLYGQGIGPIKSRIGRILTRYILSTVDMMTVRDRLSIIALVELNIHKPELFFTTEPLLCFDPQPGQSVAEFWENQPLNPQRKQKLGLIIRESTGLKFDFWRDLLENLSWNKNLELFLLVIDAQDSELNTSLAIELDLHLFKIAAWEQLQLIVGGLDLVISSRLHGLVAAVVQNVAAFGLAVDPKIEGFCLQLGIPFVLLTEDYDRLALVKKINKLLMELTDEQLSWLDQKDYWKVRALENQTILKQFLNNLFNDDQKSNS